MKRSVPPLLSIIMLFAIAVTLSCRIAGRRAFASFRLESSWLVEAPAPPVFNFTLLEFAAIDLGEARFRREIEQFTEGNFGTGRRSISSLERSHVVFHPRNFRGFPVDTRSPKFYKLWSDARKGLKDWSRRKQYQPDVMSELVRLVKLPINEHGGSPGSGQPYSSCAVVGNSGILLNSGYGGLIDSHEIVIRLNNARITNYEYHVGSRTNISFVNSNILHLCARKTDCFCHPYEQNVPMVMYICQAGHFLDYSLCNSSQKAPLLITDPRFDVLCARVVKYYSVRRFVEELGKPLEQWNSAHDGSLFHYSSGVQAVMMALGICNNVSLFGFGKSTLAKHHYHTNQRAELHLHDYEAEYAFYRDLVERPQVIPFISDRFKFPSVHMYQ